MSFVELQTDAATPEEGTAADQSEKSARKARFSNRKPGASAAIIHSDELSGALTCVVKDMSVSGARISFTRGRPKLKNGEARLPEFFTLQIRVDRIAIDCRPVWQKDFEAGVKFVSAPRVLTKAAR